MYINPINAVYKDMEVRIAQELDERIVKAVSECVVDVDKDELIKALKYDRDQYIKGYNDALDKIRAEIVELRSKQNVGVLECLDIIDKYRTESEG